MQKGLILLVCAALFLGCDSIGVFEKTNFFGDHHWKSNQQLTYHFTITDTAAHYQIYTIIRHEDAYRYNNIWVRFTTKAPGDTVKSQLLNLRLADNRKGWLGTGIDDVFDHRIRITRSPQKLRKGDYTFTLQQVMREDPIAAILNAGIRIEKVQP